MEAELPPELEEEIEGFNAAAQTSYRIWLQGILSKEGLSIEDFEAMAPEERAGFLKSLRCGPRCRKLRDYL